MTLLHLHRALRHPPSAPGDMPYLARTRELYQRKDDEFRRISYHAKIAANVAFFIVLVLMLSIAAGLLG
jgi:hypothetical protein